jgi:poly(3-hydroxybutyrate) depolymerase
MANGKTFATDPVIPPVMGECPMFDSGSATIMGANVTFLARKKAESGGYLVFYWHGTGSSPIEGSMFAGMNDIMTKGGLVVGFSSHASGGDCSGTGTHSIGDFNVADQIVACGVKDYGIDPKRIYATGCSAGGLQSGCMGINRSAYVAAVAPNSGGATIGYGPFQDETRVPATMTMHGAPGADVVIVDFSNTSEGYDNYMLAKGGFVINCNHGGGHCGAPAALQASAWQFMQDHPFGVHPSPYAGGLPSGFAQSCKIFDKATSVKLLGEGGGGMRAGPMMGGMP